MRILCTFVLLITSVTGYAEDALIEFSESMYSFSADFTQTVYDSDSTILQESSGQVQLMRPGKFRWTYTEPFSQIIVADGATLWVYDEDIAQVTMQPQATTLGSAPIGLLSGERAIESEFNVIDLGIKDDLHWFQLEPLVTDTDFNQVYIALDKLGLRAMELRDNFEQATQIRFSNFKKNAQIPTQQFLFTPPAGADVIGEAGDPLMESADETVAPDTTSLEDATPESAVQPEPVTSAEPATSVEPVPGTEAAETVLPVSDELLIESTPEPALLPQTPLPATVEDVLVTQPEWAVETPDDAPGIEEPTELEQTTQGESAEAEITESEITLEVIKTTIVPAE